MSGTASPDDDLRDIVVCSLESWDDVWRRNQFLVDYLLGTNAGLRVLFVEPPSDPIHAFRQRKLPQLPRFRKMSHHPRLRVLRPIKPLPRRLGPASDRLLFRQVTSVVRAMHFTSPVLWINDSTYAPLIAQTGFRSLYDMTDDWLLAPSPTREIARMRELERTIFATADEIVVCSPGLESSRRGARDVTLVRNAVDVGHFTRSRARPDELPPSPTAVYVGSLHESRIDVDLVLELARTVSECTVVLVGPDSLEPRSRSLLGAQQNVALLGPRTYEDIPGYLQHADVIVVPHVVTPFTESLDPIKAYECLAVSTQTVATPVAGFRELATYLTVADRSDFVTAVKVALGPNPPRSAPAPHIPSWNEQGARFEAVLRRAASRHRLAALRHADS